MNITDFKVSAAEYAGRDISSLPDRPEISAAELKARFDSPAKVVLGGKYNKMLDALQISLDSINGRIDNIAAGSSGSGETTGGGCSCGENDDTGSGEAGGTPTTEEKRIITELPIASGENLQTPCVVTFGKDGVRTPKCRPLRGSQDFLQFILPSETTSLYSPSIIPLFGNFAVIAYNKRADGVYSPCVSVAKIENGFVTDIQPIHAGPFTGSTTKISMRLRQTSKNKWIVCFCEPGSSTNYIYAFSFDGVTYSEIAKYTGVSNSTFAENKFCFVSDDTVFFKYYTSPNAYGVVVKFTGSAFTAGTPIVLYASSSDFPTVRLSDDRCVFKTTNTAFRVATISGTDFTQSDVITNPKTIAGFAATEARNRFGIFSVASPNIEFAFANISDSGVITIDTAQKVGGTAGGTPAVTALSGEFVQVSHYLENMGTNLMKASSVYSVKANGIKLMSTGAWSRYTTLTEEAAYPDPLPVFNNPYVLMGVSNANKTVLVNGMILCGSYLEQVNTTGIALSAENGVAKVLMTPGLAEGFSNLKPGAVYSVAHNGQLCEAGEHPMAVRVGTALNEETLWFAGAGGK